MCPYIGCLIKFKFKTNKNLVHRKIRILLKLEIIRNVFKFHQSDIDIILCCTQLMIYLQKQLDNISIVNILTARIIYSLILSCRANR